jgi:hypothetical protein
MLAVENAEISRDEIIAQIRAKSERVGRKLDVVVREYRAGTMVDFGLLAEAYALCELLDADDEVFKAA